MKVMREAADYKKIGGNYENHSNFDRVFSKIRHIFMTSSDCKHLEKRVSVTSGFESVFPHVMLGF